MIQVVYTKGNSTKARFAVGGEVGEEGGASLHMFTSVKQKLDFLWTNHGEAGAAKRVIACRKCGGSRTARATATTAQHANMSLPRSALLAPAAASKTSLRCFSSGASRQGTRPSIPLGAPSC